jgi:hypothetical protein
MAKKKQQSIWRFWWVALIVILILAGISEISNRMSRHTRCVQEENVCYKTECSFWGCGKIKVDINSSACEIKAKECTLFEVK